MDAIRKGKIMSRKRHTSEQIISKLREAEVELAKGVKVPQVCKKLAVTEQTYYRWRKEYGGMRLDQAKRLKELDRENGQLKRLLAEAELDKAILREAASGNC
jgi:transposase-like protein